MATTGNLGQDPARWTPEYLTTPEVRDLLRLSERTVYDLCRRGQLADAAKLGSQWRVEKSRPVAQVDSGGEGAFKSTRRGNT